MHDITRSLKEITGTLKRIEAKLTTPESQEWLEYPEGLAEALKISVKDARGLRKNGYVPSVRQGSGKGRYYFHRDDLALCCEVLGL